MPTLRPTNQLAPWPNPTRTCGALPSGWTCLGLVRHLALDVERFWFRAVVAGESVELEKGSGAWQVPSTMPAEAVFRLYRDEIERANTIIGATPLDAAAAWWPEEVSPGLPARPLKATVLGGAPGPSPAWPPRSGTVASAAWQSRLLRAAADR